MWPPPLFTHKFSAFVLLLFSFCNFADTKHSNEKFKKVMLFSKTIAKGILNLAGWNASCKLGEIPQKCVLCVAPHTSNWDFIAGKIGYAAIGGVKPNFLIKKEWFRFPFNLFFGPIGGIAVDREKNTTLADAVIKEMNSRSHFQLAITPEGTRKANPNWKKGFYFIARNSNVPLVIMYIDYKRREVCIDHIFEPTGDTNADIAAIKQWYKDQGIQGRNPEGFAI